MKKFFLFLFIIGSFVFYECHLNKIGINTADYDYVVKVTGISDGDTFKGLTNDLEEIKFRLYGIDAPEKRQSFGKKSQEYLSDLIFNKKVGIKIQKEKDAYGRPVVWVYTPDGKDVSAEMLKAGMAWHFKRYDSSPEYAAYEQKAQQEKKGLWIDSHAIPPWEFRKKEK